MRSPGTIFRAGGMILLLMSSMTAGGRTGPANIGPVNSEPVSVCRTGMRVFASDRGRILLGEVTKADFPRLLPGWDQEFKTYQPDAVDVAFLAEVAEPVEIICVLGTWCSDSEREVPRFWKILAEADNPNLELTMFAVGRASDPKARAVLAEIGFDESLRETYNVELVPTFIFRREGEELGRIVETPAGTLERDAAGILGSTLGEVPKPAWE